MPTGAWAWHPFLKDLPGLGLLVMGEVPGGGDEGEEEVHFVSAEDVELPGEVGGEFEGVIGGDEESAEVGEGEGAMGEDFEVAAEAVVDDFEVGDVGEVVNGSSEEVFEFDAVEGGQDDIGF